MDLHPAQKKIWPLPQAVLPYIEDFVGRRLIVDQKSIISASELWEALGRYERKKKITLTAEVAVDRESMSLPTFEDVFRYICAMTHSYIVEDELGISYLMGVSL